MLGSIPRCRNDSAREHPCNAQDRARSRLFDQRGVRQFVRMPCLTSFCQPLLSFLSKPARIDATPVLYKKSREKYLKKSISLGKGETDASVRNGGDHQLWLKGNAQLANAICIRGLPSLPQQLDVVKEPERSSVDEERAPASRVDGIHTKYCTLRYEYHPVCGRQRTVHGGK